MDITFNNVFFVGWVLKMNDKCIGLLGATSLVGECLQRLLVSSDWRVVAFSRKRKIKNDVNVEWQYISSSFSSFNNSEDKDTIPVWICVAPIWVLPNYFNLLKSYGVKRVVSVSSTSRYTKESSSDLIEQGIARKLVDAEMRLQNWAEENDVEWIIIQPTLIYGLGKDKNVAEIAHLIKRWNIFPLLGKGSGLRQPIHVEDVAKFCQIAITATAKNRAYTISGGETLSYKEMVKRIFMAMGKKPRFIHLPRWVFALALLGLRLLPRFKNWSVAMADRMEQDLVFDNKNAITDFGYLPRPFLLEKRDLP